MRTWRTRARLRKRARIGRGVHIGRGARIDVAAGARLVIDDHATIGAGTRITIHAGALHIGTGAVVGERCLVVVHAGVDIAPGARVNDWVSIADFEPVATDVERPIRLQGVRARPIRVGARAIVDHAANLTAGAIVPPETRVLPHEVR